MRTRLLGIDHGKRRVGLAVCDAGRLIASPLETYERKGTEADAAYFRALVEREEVGGLVLGLPVRADGSEGDQAAEVRAFGDWLGSVTGLPVAYQDERFTTKFAESALWQAGLTHKRRREKRDRVAAQGILQAYLEAGCPEGGEPGALEG